MSIQVSRGTETHEPNRGILSCHILFIQTKPPPL